MDTRLLINHTWLLLLGIAIQTSRDPNKVPHVYILGWSSRRPKSRKLVPFVQFGILAHSPKWEIKSNVCTIILETSFIIPLPRVLLSTRTHGQLPHTSCSNPSTCRQLGRFHSENPESHDFHAWPGRALSSKKTYGWKARTILWHILQTCSKIVRHRIVH